MSVQLFSQVRRGAVLRAAWAHIKANGQSKAASRTTRSLISQYALDEDRNLKRLQESLRIGRFKFSPGRGVAISKPNKSAKRPLVVFDVEARIVQRAILDTVKVLEPVATTLRSGFNFGGLEGPQFGNQAAVMAAASAFRKAGYFIRSDIKSFFNNVSRDSAIQALLKHCRDEAFCHLVRQATRVELHNHCALGEDAKYFPSADYGLAQGSCLSPLLCNLVLERFDARMNQYGCVCIRFIDDFVLFAKNRQKARAAFAVGLKELASLGLSAYDPCASDKAEEGATGTDSLTFLGCGLTSQSIRPSLQNRRHLLRKLDSIFHGGSLSFTDSLLDAKRTLMGWGNSFGFCTDQATFDDLNRHVEDRARQFVRRRLTTLRGSATNEWLGAFGFKVLQVTSADHDTRAAFSKSSPGLMARTTRESTADSAQLSLPFERRV